MGLIIPHDSQAILVSLRDLARMARKLALLVKKQVEKNPSESVIVLLWGDVGVGKTAFVKCFFKNFGIDPAKVVSPTFLYKKEYQSSLGLLEHYDLYRLTSVQAVEGLGLDRFEAKVVCIEWPQIIKDHIQQPHINVKLSHRSVKERLLSISPLLL